MGRAGLGVAELDPGSGHGGPVGVDHASGHAGGRHPLSGDDGRVGREAREKADQHDAEKATQGVLLSEGPGSLWQSPAKR